MVIRRDVRTMQMVLKRGIGFAVFTLAVVALLASLGVWQLQRRTEKHVLIAALTARVTQAPAPLPDPAAWARLTRETDEFRRVRLTATYQRLPDAMVYASGSALRDDISGPGTWAFMPARLASGETVVVDAGFVQNTMQDRAVQDRAVNRLITGQPVELTGYLRFPEAAGLLSPAANPSSRLWFVRDHRAMAESLGWGTVAPFYVDLEQPVPDSGIPKPGPLTVHLKDDHLQYAITWFGLAAVVLVAYGFWLARRGAQ